MKTNFPRDIMVVSGLPLIAMAMLTSGILFLQGTAWVVGYCLAVLTALIGAFLILKAKLPAYREGDFFTIGTRHLSQRDRNLYRSGIFLSCAGCLFCLLLLIGSTTWR